jgi:hypoxanthine phosphoribosyltransferase
MTKLERCELISWHKVYALTRRVAAQIRNAQMRPELIVAIARGGYVPARLLCDMLDIYELTSIRISHYHAGADKQPRANLDAPLSAEIQDRRVLIVDDVSDSGDTLQVALDHMQGFHPAQLKIAVLHHKTASPVIPDFYGQQLRTWRWIIYPWAVVEDVRGLLRRLPEPAHDRETAARLLNQAYGLRLASGILDEVLATYSPNQPLSEGH